MNYSSKRTRHKNFGGRARQFNNNNRNRNKGSRKTIDESKYVQAAEPVTEQNTYVTKHQFSDFPFDSRLQKNIRAKNYVTPTAIQDQSMGHILEGKDLVGTAQTGTGKTAAFLLPLISRILKGQVRQVLVIVPTRELASQINDEFRSFSENLNLYSTICIGGTNINRQIQNLKRKPQLVIATPGRLKDLHERRALKLQDFSAIVLDEVDRMLDMGFIGDIRFLISHLPKQRQSLFFSATSTPQVTSIMDSFLHNPVFVEIAHNTSSKNIQQDIVKLHRNEDKLAKLNELLKDPEFEKVLVFSRTKHGADKLSRKLYKDGHKVEAIHGDKSQGRRQQALDKFKKDKINVLVATDVAARGIDISGVSHVINYDEPENYEDYIHRIGRTGRGGNFGKALTFVQR